MRAGDVIGEFGNSLDARQPYQPHRKIYYFRSLEAETRIPFDEQVLFHDDYLVVADKPHFLPVIPSGRYLQETLLVRLKRKLGLETLSPIHRIDRETAGLVIFTVRPETRHVYQDLFTRKQIHKSYEAIAPIRSDLVFPLTHRSRLVDNPENFMQSCEGPGVPNSETQVELLEHTDSLARYRVTPITGKKHQIRVHFAALGIPLLHDQIYPVHRAENTDDYSKPLQLLAQSIAFTDPITGTDRHFTSSRHLSLDHPGQSGA